jgi:hypothetical protein
VVQRPGQQARADRAGAEPRGLLGGADEESGTRAAGAVGLQVGDELEAQDGAQRAVVPPSVGDRVDV